MLVIRFLAVLFTGLTLIAPGAHLFELLNKITLPADQYFVVQGIYRGDYSLVLGVTTISIVAVALAGFIIDLVYPLIDPRVRLG